MMINALIALLLFIAPPQAKTNKAPLHEPKIINHLLSWGYTAVDHPRKIEAIIIHSSYNALTADSFSVAGVLKEYKEYGVSPHYIIARNGTIYRLVRDRDIAYQAGKSRLPNGTTNVNAVSLGIEIVNTPHDSPTAAQYKSLASLVAWLESKYPVKYVLGHKDIAPGRKTDPWNFNWKEFDRLVKEQKRSK
jgi:N-acetyl-anhydromuramyl-L-alanine amidase AmpD